MPYILLVEDSSTQAIYIQTLLEKSGHSVQVAVDGNAALTAIADKTPDIVLTDMHMPEMNGLELIEEVLETLPNLPVVLMTAEGSEDLAVEALKKGASNYIPKRHLARDLSSILDSITTTLVARKNRSSILSALTHAETTYTFGNDRDCASALISQFEAELEHIDFDDGTGTFRIVTALKEAILNAIDHGNLELDSRMRDVDNGAEYYDLAKSRLTEEPYCYRKVVVTSRVSPEQLAYIVRDEGRGFDPSTLPDPSDPDNVLRAHGRGLLLIRSFMDDVVFNETGNQITLIKYRISPTLDTSDEPPKLYQRRNLRILMADDSATNRVLAKSLLERAGHSVAIACNGVEAVEMSAEGDLYDLILMDLEMPELDGLAATCKIRQRDASSDHQIPIIAMTGHDTVDDIQSCLDAGMQGHIGKPVRADVLNSALEEIWP